MAFAPGQFLTAQRLNRLQSKSYFSQNSGSIGTGSGDVGGTPISITVETDGATAAFTWTGSCYASGAMGGNTNTQAWWDVNASPTFALTQLLTNLEKVTSANVWVTTIPTAGTYTFKLKYTVVANSTLSIYTAMMVVITEVA